MDEKTMDLFLQLTGGDFLIEILSEMTDTDLFRVINREEFRKVLDEHEYDLYDFIFKRMDSEDLMELRNEGRMNPYGMQALKTELFARCRIDMDEVFNAFHDW